MVDQHHGAGDALVESSEEVPVVIQVQDLHFEANGSAVVPVVPEPEFKIAYEPEVFMISAIKVEAPTDGDIASKKGNLPRPKDR